MRDYKSYIYEFIKQSEMIGLELFTNNLEKSTFIALAENCCDIAETNVGGDYYFEINFNDIIVDAYYNIFVPIIKNLIDSNNEILKELEEVKKYGTKTTLIIKE